jgi:hypothetical protein
MTAGALHQRAYRRRQAEGKACVVVERDEQDIEVLVEAKVLDPGLDHFSRDALAQAVKSFLRLSRYA